MTDEFVRWFTELPEHHRAAVEVRIDQLADQGPALRRPTVATIVGSRLHNMKELRASAVDAQLRVLFVFDPSRTAILLLGGNKGESSAWNDWYPPAIRDAEALYAEYLTETNQES